MKICEYCDSSVEDDVRVCPRCGGTGSFVCVCENCGKRYPEGTVCGCRAAQSVPSSAPEKIAEPSAAENYAPAEPVQKKRHLLWWILGWIFIFPLPLTILLVRNKKMSAAARFIIIAAAWVIYFIWIGLS